jgi:hypothetical protein
VSNKSGIVLPATQILGENLKGKNFDINAMTAKFAPEIGIALDDFESDFRAQQKSDPEHHVLTHGNMMLSKFCGVVGATAGVIGFCRGKGHEARGDVRGMIYTLPPVPEGSSMNDPDWIVEVNQIKDKMVSLPQLSMLFQFVHNFKEYPQYKPLDKPLDFGGYQGQLRYITFPKFYEEVSQELTEETRVRGFENPTMYIVGIDLEGGQLFMQLLVNNGWDMDPVHRTAIEVMMVNTLIERRALFADLAEAFFDERVDMPFSTSKLERPASLDAQRIIDTASGVLSPDSAPTSRNLAEEFPESGGQDKLLMEILEVLRISAQQQEATNRLLGEVLGELRRYAASPRVSSVNRADFL